MRADCYLLVEGESDVEAFSILKTVADSRFEVIRLQIQAYKNQPNLRRLVEGLVGADEKFIVVADEDALRANNVNLSFVPRESRIVLTGDLEGCFPADLFCQVANSLLGKQVLNPSLLLSEEGRGLNRYRIIVNVTRANPGMVPPPKKRLAIELSKFCAAKGFVPESLWRTLDECRKVAETKMREDGRATIFSDLLINLGGGALLNRRAIDTFGPSGSVVFSGGGRLLALDLGDRILRRFERQGYDPEVSPDGTSIAYSAFLSRVDRRIRILNMTSSQETELEKPLEQEEYEPRWCSNGRNLVFTVNKQGRQHIWTSLASGTRRRRLADVSGRYADPRRGDNLVVFCNLEDSAKLYTVPFRGGEPRKTCDLEGCYLPRWSPNGKLIAFVNGSPPNREIYIIKFESGKLMKATATYQEAISPSWVGNSHSLVFCGQRPYDNSLNLWMIDIMNGKCYQLTEGITPGQPSYSRHRASLSR